MNKQTKPLSFTVILTLIDRGYFFGSSHRCVASVRMVVKMRV